MLRLNATPLWSLCLVPLLGMALGPLPSAEALEPFNSIYDSASNQFPNGPCAWDKIDFARPENPVLTDGILNLTTTNGGDFLGYEHRDGKISMPETLVVEARLKLLRETHSQDFRSGVGIVIEVLPRITNILFFEETGIYMLNSDTQRGPEVAVNTMDDFHTYRIEAAKSGGIKVYYDGALVLNASLYTNVATDHQPSVFWGDPSTTASGSALWTSVRHNAALIPCDTAVPVENTAWGAIKTRFD